MKKIITLLLFASFGHLAKSQQGEIGDGVFSERKFHWKQIKDTVTGWHDEDTIKYNQKGDTDWVYTDWKKQPTPESYNTESFFYLYGKDPSYYKYQNRVCGKGIVQQRLHYYMYDLFEDPKPPQTPYEKKIDSLKNNK